MLGTDCVTLANNHALDYGVDALADTLNLLAAAGIATVGAGTDLEQARSPTILATGGCGSPWSPTIHPTSPPARSPGSPSPTSPAGARLATADASSSRRRGRAGHPSLGAQHDQRAGWPRPPGRRRPGGCGATLVAGHSAHVPHGVAGRVLYDLGDFLDDYRVDPRLRNDLGLLFLVTLDGRGPVRLEALP